ncbi:MAG: hypothetical protein ACO35E_09820, partial [Ilumatobacteraceae bacterium]
MGTILLCVLAKLDPGLQHHQVGGDPQAQPSQALMATRVAGVDHDMLTGLEAARRLALHPHP